MMGDRFVSLHLRFALDSFGRDLERPGKHQRNREPNNKDEDDNLHRPLRRIERGKENRRSLNDEPRHNRVGDGYFVNIAPLQLGEEIGDLHEAELRRIIMREISPREGVTPRTLIMRASLGPRMNYSSSSSGLTCSQGMSGLPAFSAIAASRSRRSSRSSTRS